VATFAKVERSTRRVYQNRPAQANWKLATGEKGFAGFFSACQRGSFDQDRSNEFKLSRA
jgi:hypothetical protein